MIPAREYSYNRIIPQTFSTWILKLRKLEWNHHFSKDNPYPCERLTNQSMQNHTCKELQVRLKIPVPLWDKNCLRNDPTASHFPGGGGGGGAYPQNLVLKHTCAYAQASPNLAWPHTPFRNGGGGHARQPSPPISNVFHSCCSISPFMGMAVILLSSLKILHTYINTSL